MYVGLLKKNSTAYNFEYQGPKSWARPGRCHARGLRRTRPGASRRAAGQGAVSDREASAASSPRVSARQGVACHQGGGAGRGRRCCGGISCFMVSNLALVSSSDLMHGCGGLDYSSYCVQACRVVVWIGLFNLSVRHQ